MKKLLKNLLVFQSIICLILLCHLQCFAKSTDTLCDTIWENADYLAHNNSTKEPDNGPKITTAKNKSNKIDTFVYLSSCGYPKEFLETLPNATLNNIVESHKNNKVIDLKCETQYWPDKKSDTAKLIIKRFIAKMQNVETGRFVGESVCVYWEWIEKRPFIREEDLISIKWNNYALNFDSGSFWAEDFYRNSAIDKWYVSNSYTKPANLTSKSLGHWSDLNTFNNQVGGILIFNLVTNSTKITESIEDGLAISYTHKTDIFKTTFFTVFIFAIFVLIVIFRYKKRADVICN